MAEVLQLGDVSIDVIFKDIGNLHLSVYPPTGRVRVSAPDHLSLDAIRLFAISKIGWIRRNQRRQVGQERETPREYLDRESHHLWGKRYLLQILEPSEAASVEVTHRTIEMYLPAGSSAEDRQKLLDDLYRRQLRERAAELIAAWEKRLAITVDRFFVQRMKTKWGSSHPERRTIRLNLELAKFDRECLDYVILHEMAHFLVPNHRQAFADILDRHKPGWQTVRARLNKGPLAAID